ncbi:MAG TPA: hypothetical protein VGR52_13190 [Stellaceae bacterium]|nr:hypothetical protein [Stellaceae bacterium]
MPITGEEAWFGLRIFRWVKRKWDAVFGAAARLDALEKRITNIDAAKSVHRCDACGADEMYRTYASSVLGSVPNQYRRETWQCRACGAEEQRSTRF